MIESPGRSLSAPPVAPPSNPPKKGNSGLPVAKAFLIAHGLNAASASAPKSNRRDGIHHHPRPLSRASAKANTSPSSKTASRPLGLVATAKPAESPARTSQRKAPGSSI